jgi:hypothetical protein
VTFKEKSIEVKMEGIDGDLVELIEDLPNDLRPRSLKEIKKQREAKSSVKSESKTNKGEV